MNTEVSVSVKGDGMYDGLIVDDVNPSFSNKMVLTYSIEEEYRSWGIESISITNVKGPSEIDVTLLCYQEGSNDPIEKDITIPLNWEDQGQISINDYVTIRLYFRENNIIETEITLDVYTL